jgi:exodeoxyribonuclease-5
VTNDEVCYATFTGKAATVLQQKNCPNATTLHKLLYNVKPLPDGSYSFKAKDKWEFAGYKVFVIDEISMVPMDMWNLLLRCGVYILATGDPG